MIRTLWVLASGVVLTAFYASRVVINSWVGRSDQLCRCDWLARRWSLLVLRLAGARVVLEGVDRVDWSKACVVVSNHQSWFDVFALAGCLPGHVRFVAKQELGRIPIFGRAWRTCGHVSIDRSDRREAIASLDRAAEHVRKEALTMVLFPEGTRSPDGRLYEFKKGAFVLAIKTGVPIVPLGISGSRHVMPKGSFRISAGEIRIRVGEPIPVHEGWLRDRDALRRQSRAAVAALIDGEDALAGEPDEGATTPKDDHSQEETG